MSRPLRIQFPEAVYHVMNRGARRQSTFADDADYQAFLDTLTQAHRLWGIEVFAYSLMGNHYHLCLRTPKGNLSRVMRHVDGLYTQRSNDPRAELILKLDINLPVTPKYSQNVNKLAGVKTDR